MPVFFSQIVQSGVMRTQDSFLMFIDTGSVCRIITERPSPHLLLQTSPQQLCTVNPAACAVSLQEGSHMRGTLPKRPLMAGCKSLPVSHQNGNERVSSCAARFLLDPLVRSPGVCISSSLSFSFLGPNLSILLLTSSFSATLFCHNDKNQP